MTRSRSALLAWLACALGVSFAVRLGVWQLDRADQKRTVLTEQAERAKLPPLAPDALARTDADAAAQWHRQIGVRGRWLSEKTLYLDNQPLEGRTGFIAVTPLLLAPGDAVLVQRGWAARDPADRTRVPTIETPESELTLLARIAPWPSRRFDLGPEEAGRIRQNLDADTLALEWGVKLRPLTLLELEQSPAAGARWLRRWNAPVPDIGKHHGYALQWFAIAALIAGLTVWYRILKPRREERR
jgi:surfeit locus 1 family protein